MRHLILPIALLLLAGGCSKSPKAELPGNPGEAVPLAFYAHTPTYTRSNDIQTVGESFKFKVIAYGNGGTYIPLSEAGKGRSQGKADLWGTTTPYYWPDYPLYVFAYAPATGGGVTPSFGGFRGNNRLSIETPSNIADQKDVIAGCTTGTKAPEMATGIAINFRHLLAQIDVKAKIGSKGSGHKIKVIGVKLGNFKTKAVFNYPANTDGTGLMRLGAFKFDTTPTRARLTAYSGTGTAPLELSSTENKPLTPSGESFFVLPQATEKWLGPEQYAANKVAPSYTNSDTGAYLAVCMNVETVGGFNVIPRDSEGYTWVAVPLVDASGNALTFNPGTHYTINLIYFSGANDALQLGYMEPHPADTVTGSSITNIDATPDNNKNYPGKPVLTQQLKFSPTITAIEQETTITYNL